MLAHPHMLFHSYPFVLFQLGRNEQWQNRNDDEDDDEDFLPGSAMCRSIIFVALVYIKEWTFLKSSRFPTAYVEDPNILGLRIFLHCFLEDGIHL